MSACAPAPDPDGAVAPGATAAPARATPRDAATTRAAATRALSEQRFYAPAGDNAIEHYLALRDLQPDDEAVQLALLELLPYPVIASEQAIGRGEFAEARRLLALVERTDAAAPSLARLRESLANAEAEQARRVIEVAEAEKQREREAARLGSAATPAQTAPMTSAPAPADPAPSMEGDVRAAAAPPPSAATPSAAPPSAAITATPSPPATMPTPSPPVAANAPVPRVASAPPPRYPALALRRRIEGEVTVAFTVRADGGVESPRVVSATPSGVFEEAALAAIQRWRFEPVARPVESRQVLRFRLPGGEGT